MIGRVDSAGARARLVRTTGWFACLAALLAMLLGHQYLGHYQWPAPLDAQIYSVLAYFSHFGLLVALPWVVLVVPLCLVLPRPRLVLPLSVLLAAGGLAWLLLDALLFAEHQFHINALTMTILGTQTWMFGLVYLLIFVALGGFAMRSLWQSTARPARRNRGVWLALSLLVSLGAAQIQHLWADAHYYVPITRMTHYLPLYQPITARRFLAEYGLVDLSQMRENQLLDTVGERRAAGQNLAYPQRPLQCTARRPQLNLVMLIVDAMRADMLNDSNAPRLNRFAAGAQRYEAHYSGGNSSRIGLFSLFYGLPATYWQNIEALQVPAVMMSELRARGYQVGIFASSPIYRPVGLDRTAFAAIPDLRLQTPSADDRSSARDRIITDEWLAWVAGADPQRPFFGFVYYDAPTTRDFPDDYPTRFTAVDGDRTEIRRANYMTAVHYVDSLAGRVLDDLAARGLLDSTVVLVTSDHGEEFDDNGLGFNGHGSAYNRTQLQVPFVLHWPGRAGAGFSHRTSHNDWSATVMRDLLGCSNPASDFSSGKSLFEARSWDWLIAGSYHNFAIVEPHQVTVSQVGGTMDVRDDRYRPIDDPVLNRGVISDALRETNRFYASP